MRRSYSVQLLVAAMLFSALPAQATDIKEKEYGYIYGDTVKAMADDTFVVCGGCKSDKLSKALRDFVAIKYNPPSQEAISQTDPLQATPMIAMRDSGNHDSNPIVGTVLFPFDSGSLKSSEKAKLDRIAVTIPEGADLTATGYSCKIGSKKYNQKLSERRAKTVAAYLGKKGVKIKTVEGKGECCPVSVDKKLNRRVELLKGEIHAK